MISRSEDKNYNQLALAFIALNALIWWLLYSTGRASLDTYGDMAEAYSWGISWQLGYDKHPPLSAWTAAAWFELFPTRDWAYYLLAVINQAVAFWFVYLAGKRWMTPAHALFAVTLTSLIPLFGPDTGFKFNANSAMLPWVSLFAWSLIAAFQTHARRYLIIAGLAGGAACMVKYWAPLMLAAITLGVLIIEFESTPFEWRKGFGKLSLIAGVTVLILVPHITWAVRHQWPGLHYAHSAHQFAHGSSSVVATWNMLVDLFLVALLPVVVWLSSVVYLQLTSAAKSKAIKDECFVNKDFGINKLQGISIFTFAVLFTAESAHLAGIAVAPKWLIPAWLFFSWFLCAALPKFINVRQLVVPMFVSICIYWIGLFVYVGQINPSFDMFRDATNPRHTIADEVTQVFRSNFGQPLKFVAGDDAFAFSASFYSKDHPVAVADLDFVRTSWVDESQVRHAGVVVICEISHPDCVKATVDHLGPAQATRVWHGLDEDGDNVAVTELFYAPTENGAGKAFQ